MHGTFLKTLTLHLYLYLTLLFYPLKEDFWTRYTDTDSIMANNTTDFQNKFYNIETVSSTSSWNCIYILLITENWTCLLNKAYQT